MKYLFSLLAVLALSSSVSAGNCSGFFGGGVQQQVFAAPSYSFQSFAPSYAVAQPSFFVQQQPVVVRQFVQRQPVVVQRNFHSRQRIIVQQNRGLFRRENTIVIR